MIALPTPSPGVKRAVISAFGTIIGRVNIGEGLSKSFPQSWLSNRLPVFGIDSVYGVDMVGPRGASTDGLYDGYGALPLDFGSELCWC